MSVETRAFVLRRNWLPVILSAALVVASVLAIKLSSGPIGLFGYFGIWFGITFGPVLFLRNSFPRRIPITCRATAKGLTLEGEEEIPNEDILEAKILPRRGEAIVELSLRKGQPVALRMGHREAKALVDFLGARRSRFRLVVPFLRRFLASTLLCMGVLAILVGRPLEMALAVLPGALMWGLVLAWLVGFVRGRLVVGADGFTRRWLFWERFIAFRDVVSVKGVQRVGVQGTLDTVIKLASGRTVRLQTVEAPNTEEERGGESLAMLAHVTESFERSMQLQNASVDVPALVERGSRSAREWLSGLDALVRGGGSRYRVAAVSPEMLTDVTNDPTAKTESRVGAAAALVRMDDDSLRLRVRIAAEGCADTELRATLLALAEARDEYSTEAALGLLRR